MNTTTKETEMKTALEHITEVMNSEHQSTWDFCAALKDWETTDIAERRATGILAQGLFSWADHRRSARKAYESTIKDAGWAISDIDNNLMSSFIRVDASRVNEYNDKASAQVECVRTAAYIIGLDNEALIELFVIVSKLEFNKEAGQ